jgi:hypothetical protein
MSFSFSVTGRNIKQVGKSKFEVEVDDFITLDTKLRNRSSSTIYPLLRLRPYLGDQPHEVALDLGKRFAWGGVLQRVLPSIAPGADISVKLTMCALCAGELEIGATVEETKVALHASDLVNDGKNEVQVLDALLDGAKRRIWTAEEGCRIIALDVGQQMGSARS